MERRQRQHRGRGRQYWETKVDRRPCALLSYQSAGDDQREMIGRGMMGCRDASQACAARSHSQRLCRCHGALGNHRALGCARLGSAQRCLRGVVPCRCRCERVGALSLGRVECSCSRCCARLSRAQTVQCLHTQVQHKHLWLLKKPSWTAYAVVLSCGQRAVGLVLSDA